MMCGLIRKLLLAVWVVLPNFSGAAEPLILPRDDISPQVKRFIPLDSSRTNGLENQKGVTIIRDKTFIPLRTDKRAIDNGKLLTDRTRTADKAAPIEKPEVKQATDDVGAVRTMQELEPESDSFEGDTETINPVIALYGSANTGPLGSFSDVMRGVGAASIAGLSRHTVWPIPLAAKQYVSSGYGIRNDPFHGRPTFHGGIDIAADAGTAVLATAAGEVMQVTEDSRYGKYIGIAHADGVVTRYGHLSSQSVSVGQRVRAGQLIGAVGSTGRSTGAHLDYRVSKNGVKYDPLSILTVPSNVVVKATSRTRMAEMPAINVFRGNNVASNPTPKRPMVIKVQ